MKPFKTALTIRQQANIIRHALGFRVLSGGRVSTALKALEELADELEKENTKWKKN